MIPKIEPYYSVVSKNFLEEPISSHDEEFILLNKWEPVFKFLNHNSYLNVIIGEPEKCLERSFFVSDEKISNFDVDHEIFGANISDLTNSELRYFKLGLCLFQIVLFELRYGRRKQEKTRIELLFSSLITRETYSLEQKNYLFVVFFNTLMKNLNDTDLEIVLEKILVDDISLPLKINGHNAIRLHSSMNNNIIRTMNYIGLSKRITHEEQLSIATSLKKVILKSIKEIYLNYFLNTGKFWTQYLYRKVSKSIHLNTVHNYADCSNYFYKMEGTATLQVPSGEYIVSFLSLKNNENNQVLCELYSTQQNFCYNLTRLLMKEPSQLSPTEILEGQQDSFKFYYNEEAYSDQTRGIKKLMRTAKKYAQSNEIKFIDEPIKNEHKNVHIDDEEFSEYLYENMLDMTN